MAAHSSTVAWKIPWAEEPGRLQSMGSQRVGHDWATSLSLFTFMHWRRKWQPTPVFLLGESQGRESLVGCHLWGRTESDTTEATWQQQQQQVFFISSQLCGLGKLTSLKNDNSKRVLMKLSWTIWKDSQYHLSVENCAIRKHWKTTTYLLEWIKSRKLTTPNAVEGVQQQELSFIAGGELQLVQLIWKTFWQFLARLRQWHPTPVLLLGKSHGRRRLVGCSPWGH